MANAMKNLGPSIVAPAAPYLSALTTGGATYAGIANSLTWLGFGSAGVAGGSIAAAGQSVLYGAAVPAGGWFATLTSWGATGAVSSTLGIAAVPIGVAVAAGTWVLTAKK